MATIHKLKAGSETVLTYSTLNNTSIISNNYRLYSHSGQTMYYSNLPDYTKRIEVKMSNSAISDQTIMFFSGAATSYNTVVSVLSPTTRIDGDYTYYCFEAGTLTGQYLFITYSGGGGFYYGIEPVEVAERSIDEWISFNLNEMGETSQQGTQKTISASYSKAINALSWTIQSQSSASYKIYQANLTSIRDKKFIIKAKTTSNNILPYPSSGATSSNSSKYFYCTINTNSGASLLAPINVREITYGQEYEFELPTNANYVVLAADIANLYELEEVPAWIDGALHQRASGSWT